MAGDEREGEGGPATVALAGPITLAEAPRVRDALLTAFASGRNVCIYLEEAGPWDLSGLQLIFAALATGRRTGQGVRLSRLPEGFLSVAEQAGVAHLLAGAIDDVPRP